MHSAEDEIQGFESEPEETDLPEELTSEHLRRIALGGSDWTTETILTQLRRGNINLSPRFQRRDAWTKEKKSKFIESLILNLPVPQIVLAERRDSRGQYIVLDGKQRLTSILQFAGAAAEDDPANGFALRSMEVLEHLNRNTYGDLLRDDRFRPELDAFQNQTIRTVVIRNWDSESVLHLIFVRLNTTNVPLAPQELRQALYPGPFANFIDDKSHDSAALKVLMGLEHPDFRMRDVEILLRYFAFSYFLEEYSGNMSRFLNFATGELNRRFHKDEEKIEESARDFEAALQLSIDIFGAKNVARKWTGSSYESRWNRAILDVLLFYFTDGPVRQRALVNQDNVIEAYKGMFERGTGFREAVEATTKSLTATYTRISLWGEALEKALGVELPVPKWDVDRNRLIRPTTKA